MQKPYVAVAVAALFAAAVGLYLYFQTPRDMPTQTQIRIDSHALWVEVADTEPERQLGLSGRLNLTEGQGLLFVFDSDDKWGIWMKDMRFAIDILWADAAGRVVTVVQNADPGSYPQIFYPTLPARYVLEVPAGYAGRHGIAEGSQLKL